MERTDSMTTLVRSAIDLIDRTTQSTIRAVAYLRVSTEDQAEGYGIAYTDDVTSAHIRMKGWSHSGTFRDEGVSGSLPWTERPDLRRLMELAHQTPRPFDVVVVAETRAIGRRDRVFFDWVWKLQDIGVAVAIVDEDVDNTTEEGEQRMRELANEAFKEYNKIKKRTRSGIQKKANIGGEGSYVGGRHPSGYRVEDRARRGRQRLVVDDCDHGTGCAIKHEAPPIRLARELYVKYRCWRDVAALVNASGALNRSGRPWTPQHIAKCVIERATESPVRVFRGPGARRNVDGTPAVGASAEIPLPPMFTPDEVREFQHALKLRVPRQGRRGGGLDRLYILRGRIVSLCGKTYAGGGKMGSRRGQFWYQCSGRTAQALDAVKCSCASIPAPQIEEYVWSGVAAMLGDADRLRAMAEDAMGVAAEKAVDLPARLAKMDAQIATQDGIIAVTAGATAGEFIRAGMAPAAAQAAVQAALKPLVDERERLAALRDEAASWQQEAEAAQGRARDLQALAARAHQHLGSPSPAEKAELLALLDVRVTVLSPPPRPLTGAPCTVSKWFRTNECTVPALTEEVWSRAQPVLDRLEFRSLTARQLLGGVLHKARTGCGWDLIPAEYGNSIALQTRWKRLRESVWPDVMAAIGDVPGTPVPDIVPLPKVSIAGAIKPRLLLGRKAATEDLSPWATDSHHSFKFQLRLTA